MAERAPPARTERPDGAEGSAQERPDGGAAGAAIPRVLMVASFPPPVTGQTVATQAFARWTEEVARLDRLDLADPDRHQRPSGAFSWSQLQRVRRVRDRIRSGPGWEVGYLTLASSTLGSLRDVALLRAMRPRVRRLVVHVHQGSFGLATRGLLRAPVRRALLETVDRFVFIAGTLAAWAPWIPRERLRIVPNPPGEGARFTAAEVETLHAARAEEEAFRVLFLANPLPEKGHGRLLEALPAVREALGGTRRLEVHVVGAWSSPDRRERYQDRVDALGLGEEVRVHGAVTDREVVRDLLGRAHVLAFPSTYREEGAPLAVIEAMGAGTPVVASTHGALPEMVADGESGIVLETPRPESLARALASLADRDRWRAFSRGARTRYEARYAPDAVRRTFLRVLLEER